MIESWSKNLIISEGLNSRLRECFFNRIQKNEEKKKQPTLFYFKLTSNVRQYWETGQIQSKGYKFILSTFENQYTASTWCRSSSYFRHIRSRSQIRWHIQCTYTPTIYRYTKIRSSNSLIIRISKSCVILRSDVTHPTAVLSLVEL